MVNSAFFLVSSIAVEAKRSRIAAVRLVVSSIFSAIIRTSYALVIFLAAVFFAEAVRVFAAVGTTVFFAGAFVVAMEPHTRTG